MPSRLAKLYEKAWNETVNNCNDWQRNIIINHPLSKDRMHKDVSDEVARDASRLAERWYDEMMAVPSGQSPDADMPF
jgi:hypothetical protein